MQKIRPDATPGTQTSATISAAKNEFESFQVVVTGPATQVSATASALTGPGTIASVNLYREEIINLQYPSSADGAVGPFPDALVPDVDDVVGEKRNAFPFDVAAGTSRAIWVEVHVPSDAAPGNYQGKVIVHTGEGDAVVPVTLTVWDFALPSTSSLKSYFGLAYGSLVDTDSGVDLSQLRARYVQLGLDHRISVANMDDGSIDLSHFDQYYGALMDGTAPTQLKGAKLTSLKYIGGDSSSDYAAWAQHFRGRGWFDRLFQYTCDEPPMTCNWSDIPTRAATAKAGDPDFRTLVTTTIQDADANGVTSSIDLLVPVINWLDDKPDGNYPGPQRSQYDPFLSQGGLKEVWTYQSCMSHGCGGTVDLANPSSSSLYFTGWPSYMIDANAVRARALEWFSFRYGLTGELYYETTMAYSQDPWSNQWEFSGNGDGTLFYPGTPDRIGGTTHIPIASIRLKMIREGMEDYEYLKALSDAGDPALASELAAQLFTDAFQTDIDPAALMAARQMIALRILELTGKTLPPSGDVASGTAASSSSGSGSGTPQLNGDLKLAGLASGCSTGATPGLLALAGLAGALRRRRRARARGLIRE